MAQKTKVKELVGRGLDSYHTKSLQQIDRIEKKNKQQNHKISILSNELDNDYLTKTEEGSVVSLEHSKEGMVYIDSLEGNTLVNYCTDGTKELTLNGDIDLEGTFVTTTEGVDNGKVDVYCEGNTLVNLSPNTFEIGCPNEESTTTFWFSGEYINNSLFKPNTEYSVIFYNKHPEVVRVYFHLGEPRTKDLVNNMAVFTTPSTITTDKNIIHFYTNNNLSKQQIEQSNMKVVILEGDWTNREIPPYFESMKSVGQDDVNGHKIEILSQNKNLCKSDLVNIGKFMNTSGQLVNNETQVGSDFIQVVSGENIVSNLPNNNYFKEFDINKKHIRTIENSSSYTISKQAKYITFNFHHDNPSLWVQQNQVNINYGSTLQTYTEGLFNKKEILLNEPLRKANDNVKDRFVKINGKLYIERNCKQLTITGNEPNVVWRSDGILGNVYRFWSNNFPNCITLNADGCVFMGSYEGVYQANAINIQISTSKIAEDNVELFVEYLKQNPLTLVIKKDKPIYEPLEINPELICYNDTTHISNNSIIPCTMKIKNTGYNAIIKPSTLYTIALDTNKSGTIGMNLGGTKGTTTNNVLTLTTPATLTDDSLRLHGKGIKGSKVRLLEGDKTNCIPSHFEGMKSSFEDKFDATDNTYKMEILSNKGGMNLCTNSDDIRGGVASGIILEKVDDKGYKNVAKLSGDLSGSWFSVSSTLTTKISPNTTITISVLARTDKPNNQSKLSFYLGDGQEGSYISFNEPLSNEYKWISQTRKFISNSFRPHFGLSYFNGYSVYISKMKIEFGNKMTEWCPSIKDASWLEYENYNKIQFSSIEPLRKLDKFVFKDNMLMVERNNAEKVLNGTENWSYDTSNSTQEVGRFGLHNEGMKGNRSLVICDKYAFKTNYTMTSHNYEGTFTSIGGNTLYLDTMLNKLETKDLNGFKKWLSKNPVKVVYELVEPVYEEIPFELQKIILEGYENGTLFFDTNIPPTSTVTYAGETPIVKATKLNKTEVLNNTTDINDNIIPYLMDMDYRVVCLELAAETQGISMARLFGGVYEMLKRDILSSRYSIDEYKHRLDVYLSANKITNEEYEKLGDMLNE